MQHVLSQATKANVFTDPFPHILVENAVEKNLLDRLIAELPTPGALARGASLDSNRHFVRGWDDPEVPPLWKEFIDLHMSQGFFDRVIELVGDHMLRMNPKLSELTKPLNEQTVGLRRKDTLSEKEALLDGQVFVTTPVIAEPDSYRIGHLDAANKLYNGLLYLRLPGDDSVGANLELCRWKGEKKKFHNKRRKLIDHKYIEAVKTIPYRAGTFVLIPNSFNSVHRVQARQKTLFPRYYMNVLCELPVHLFDLSPYWENPFETLKRKIKL